MYFAVPTPPRDLRATPASETELQVEWQPPHKPGGNITHYYILWQPIERAPGYLDQRDYCADGKKSTIYCLSPAHVGLPMAYSLKENLAIH